LSNQTELNEFEALNIIEATEWAIKSRIVKNSLLTDKTLRIIHEKMFGKTWRWAGAYRTTQKNIGVEPYRISSEVKILLDDVVFWIDNQTYPPDEIAARFHHRLVSIHCYPNGNGRHARVATDLLCRSQDWSLPTWGSGDLVSANSVRQAYLEALRTADQHDYTPLVAFMCI
jgi:Fic-DOC domain mobile mystery protein B